MSNNISVLVADDEPMLRRVITKVLRRWGYDVVAVEDGSQAWSKLQLNKFDLHIFDQNMPGYTGTELLTKLKATDPHIKIVISSGDPLSFENDLVQPTGFLEKPFVLKGLREKIEGFLV